TRYIQRDKIDFFTGPIGSNVALAVGPALFAAKVPYLSNNPGPSQYAGERCNRYWFGTSYQNDAFHEAAGKVAADRGFKNVLIMAPDYPAGKGALTGFKRGDKSPVAEEVYTKLGQHDAFSAAPGRVAAARGFQDVLIMAPDYPAGKDALTGFKRGYKSPAAEEVHTKLGQLDYAAELAQIRAAKPDAVFIFLPGGMG